MLGTTTSSLFLHCLTSTLTSYDRTSPSERHTVWYPKEHLTNNTLISSTFPNNLSNLLLLVNGDQSLKCIAGLGAGLALDMLIAGATLAAGTSSNHDSILFRHLCMLEHLGPSHIRRGCHVSFPRIPLSSEGYLQATTT